MKELKFTKVQGANLTSVTYRFSGKDVFIKKQQGSVQTNEVIKRLRDKGAEVSESKNWIRLNFIKDQKNIKLAGQEHNLEGKSDEDIEKILAEFYKEEFLKGGFKIEEK